MSAYDPYPDHMAERAGEEFDGRYASDEPLSNPCPECGDFDCVYWVQVDRLAECRSCGATLEEVFYTSSLYDSPVPASDSVSSSDASSAGSAEGERT